MTFDSKRVHGRIEALFLFKKPNYETKNYKYK